MSHMGNDCSTEGLNEQFKFVDLFAGCGGLSLGLMKAGWKGLFAIEQSPMAFETLRHNLIDQDHEFTFDWPNWLTIEPVEISSLLDKNKECLSKIEGISLIAGGPPCQGFSIAGKRNPEDARNRLVDYYIEFVKIVKPKVILVENVRNFATSFRKTRKGGNGYKIKKEINASTDLQKKLSDLGYSIYVETSLMARDFGVPQLRPRYILIGYRSDLITFDTEFNPFNTLREEKTSFLDSYGLPFDREITLGEAISDLERRNGTVECIDHGMRRFKQGVYGSQDSRYQEIMRKKIDGGAFVLGDIADSHRFANHREDTVERFQKIIKNYRPGVQLNQDELKSLGLSKHRIAPLAKTKSCHTLTSLPDDMVHYSEPRILTVREYARIQSFPDWFEFKSKYTTGGERRRYEVPRYTQVANAVPPLVAEAIGKTIIQSLLRDSQANQPLQ